MAIYPKRIISICSGIGALDLGIKLAVPSSRTVCYVERETYSASILAARMRDGVLDEAPIWSNLATFQGRSWRGRVEIIIGGFPCQPWSVAGKREGTADDRWLWYKIERIIRDMEPQAVFVENVPGLCRGGIEHVIGTMATLGYDAEWGVFSAAETGAPQLRERLFIYGQMVNSNSLRFKDKISPVNGRHSDSSSGNMGAFGRQILFPPGPMRKNDWAKICKKTPDLKPAFHNLVDGDARWVGRRRKTYWKEEICAVGNSVVPLAVALAFKVLHRRLNGF